MCVCPVNCVLLTNIVVCMSIFFSLLDYVSLHLVISFIFDAKLLKDYFFVRLYFFSILAPYCLAPFCMVARLFCSANKMNDNSINV